MLTTKAAQSGGLGLHISRQLLRRPEPLMVCGVMLLFLAILPGFPILPFGTLGMLALGGASQVKKRVSAESAGAQAVAGAGPKEALPSGSRDDPTKAAKPAPAPVQPMCLEIGFGLVPLVDQRLNGDLVTRLGAIRDEIRQELGFMIPPIAVQDNLELGNNEYRVLLRGLERARGSVHVGQHLAINPGDVSGTVEGMRTRDPAFGFEAVWIHPRRIDAAESRGYTVVECSSVIATHVTKVVKDSAAELLTRQSVSDVIEQLKTTDKAVVEELVPQRLSVGVIHRVLQYLLAEQVPIHDLPAVLETLSDYAGQSKDPLVLCEFCRQALRGHIAARFLGRQLELHSLILHPRVEAMLQEVLTESGGGILALSPARAEALTDAIADQVESAQGRTENTVVLLTSPSIRPHLARLVRRKSPDLPVMSYAEVSDDVQLQVVGTVAAEPEPQAEVHA
jgi:flagellar biosynthesis protein FlhA